MFAFSAARDIMLPMSLNTADDATMNAMFMHTNIYHQGTSAYGNAALMFDASGINFSKVASTASMFKGFNFIMAQYVSFVYDDVVEQNYIFGSSINFGSQEFSKCADMSSMFELCPLGVDMSNVTAKNVKNMNRMFTLSGFSYLPIKNIIQRFGNEAARRTSIMMIAIGAYFTEIKLPSGSSTFKTVEGATCDYMFTGAKSGNLNYPYEPITTATANPFYNIATFSIIPAEIDISFIQTVNVSSMEGMFMLYSGSVDLTSINLTNCVNTKKMFDGYGLMSLFNLSFYQDISARTLPSFMDIFSEVKWPSTLKFNSNCRTDYMFTMYLARPNKTEDGYRFDFSFMDVSNLKRFDYMFCNGLGLFNYDLSA